MLAVVDDFVYAGMQIGTRATAEVASSFNDTDFEPGLRKSAGGGQAGNAGANDGYGALLVAVWGRGFDGTLSGG